MPQVSLEALIAGVRAGKVVSFPTDTIPALASLPEYAELIFATKKRALDKPLILMAAKAEDLWPYVKGSPEEMQIWQEVAKRCWPGALTLVLPAQSDRFLAQMNPLEPTTIGVRVPNSASARKILAETGPLATTSANLSGEPPLLSAAAIEAKFPEVLVLSPEAFASEVATGVASTVAKWKGSGWEILRQGEVKI
ncbi:MAG: L-threonylcarbamoyladenylate synthase [Oscillatoriaceae bacterium SKW80]|nr:L-threonylcarbamoyladenylate synthase [Oscillatoriaceae bacterium SKYG93]MCX8121380.1 L-threonylcarbamoyladenylate synthase [Oscillatoriaceae bacterium SKW80]MDW8451943.1 L-threonylcarbamoyladenylate synthase [Oscillatoriaceae cyanobacterium SKYGB_i_bin93]HIK29486.1 L-threonylcarbamoyladenylate synthase [Oscillatoriaceae cyanobacterium M7585_C2015_266]